jgi:hypothetical protein
VGDAGMTAVTTGNQPDHARRRRFGELPIVVGMGVLTLLIMAGLYFASRNQPSSESNHPSVLLTPVISVDQGCDNFATYWMSDSGVPVTAEQIEALTNCWQAADGSWFVLTSPTDPRLPTHFAMTDNERLETRSLRQDLVAQMSGLEQSLSRSMQRDLESIYDPRVRPVSGHLKDGQSITRARSRYSRVVQAYLMSPENTELAAYVGWLMGRRIDAYNDLNKACQTNSETEYLNTVCNGLGDSLSVRYPPFIWDLQNPVMLEAYLADRARTQRLPAQSSTGSVVPASGAAAG